MNRIRSVMFKEFLHTANELLDSLDGEYDYATFVEKLRGRLDELGKKICREALEATDAGSKDNTEE